jgi:cell division septum initiation protein DivIVA
MSVDIGLFGPQADDEEVHPDFNKVLLGFDPRHVEEFVAQAEERIAQLERQVRDARAHADAANRRAAAAREEAYGEIAGRMAELLRAADHQAEKLRHDTDEACHRQLAEASQEADQVRREAEARAESLRADGEIELANAKAESRRVLGELARHRDVLIGELESIRGHLVSLVGRVENAVRPPEEGRAGGEVAPLLPTMAPGVDDLLDSTAGFDLAPMVVWEDDAPEGPAEPFEELSLEADGDPDDSEEGAALSTVTETIDLTHLLDEDLDEPGEPADPAAAE